jgi:hypothetical protein
MGKFAIIVPTYVKSPSLGSLSTTPSILLRNRVSAPISFKSSIVRSISLSLGGSIAKDKIFFGSPFKFKRFTFKITRESGSRNIAG